MTEINDIILEKEILVWIAKLEAFKIINPLHYDKIIEEMQDDIEQIIRLYNQMQEEMIWH